jgi:hypothetical protein
VCVYVFVKVPFVYVDVREREREGESKRERGWREREREREAFGDRETDIKIAQLVLLFWSCLFVAASLYLVADCKARKGKARDTSQVYGMSL